jgi:hypothetical protein
MSNQQELGGDGDDEMSGLEYGYSTAPTPASSSIDTPAMVSGYKGDIDMGEEQTQ